MKKVVSLAMAFIMLLTLVPSFSVSAEQETPDYLNQGTVSVEVNGGYATLEATPITGNLFFGWYKDGTKVSEESSITVPAAEKDDYVPNFAVNNIISDAGFENYDVGTDLKKAAGWNTDSDIAITAELSGMQGERSLNTSGGGMIYRKITGLEQHKLYTFTFAYKSKGLDTASIYSGVTGPGTGDDGRLGYEVMGYSAESYSLISITFDSLANTEIYIVFNTYSNLRLDNLSLVKDESTSGILSNDFEDGTVYGWSANGGNISLGSSIMNKPTVEDFGYFYGQYTGTSEFSSLYSPTFNLDSGAEYKLTFWIKCDSSFPKVHTVNGDPNFTSYINLNLTASKNSADVLLTDGYCSYRRYDENNGLIEYIDNLCAGREGKGSQVAIGVDSDNYSIIGGWNKFEFIFTAPNGAGTGNLVIRPNPRGTLFVDNVKLQKISGDDDDFNVYDSTEFKGASVRTDGIQALRFKTNISKNDIVNYGIKEYGALVIKQSDLQGRELIFNGYYNKQPYVATAYKKGEFENIFADNGSSIDFTAALINIPFREYSENYCYRPYFIVESGIVYYGDTVAYSLADTAKYAYNAKNPDQTFCEPDGKRQYLYEKLIKGGTANIVLVYNDSPIVTNYLGLSAAVYHGTTYMNDRYGRNYTEQQAQMEFDRLEDSGIKLVRTIFKSAWAANQTTFTGYNWDSEQMQAFYKWAGEMQKRGIDVALNCGWHLNYITSNSASGSITEITYLLGNGNDYYGESSGADFSGLNSEQVRMKKASLRYGEWVSRAVLECRKRGLNNIKYILPFTEPSYTTPTQPEGPDAENWITMVAGLNSKLKENGIRDTLEIIGPNQGSISHGNGLLRYLFTSPNFSRDMVDIYSAHFYPTGDNIKQDVFMDICNNTFSSYKQTLDDYNCDSPLICDEFFARSNENSLLTDEGWKGTQTVVGAISAMQNGLMGNIIWQFSDQLWTNQTNTGGEFRNGFHIVGMMPSFVDSMSLTPYTPKKQYYAVGLYGKFMSDGKASSYRVRTLSGDGIYCGAVELSDGNWSVAVVNVSSEPQLVDIDFSYGFDGVTFNRYMFDPSSVNPTDEADLGSVDRRFYNVSGTISDVIPSGGVCIYTTKDD